MLKRLSKNFFRISENETITMLSGGMVIADEVGTFDADVALDIEWSIGGYSQVSHRFIRGKEAVLAFLATHGLTYHVVRDAKGKFKDFLLEYDI